MTPLPDPAHRAAEQAARASYGKLVALLAARNGDIAAAEDALSDALVAALETWPKRGVPANPEGWLMTTARNRQLNRLRAGFVRQRAEPDLILRLDQTSETGEGRASLPDDRLRLMFVCTHPAIDPSVRAPLILQTVLGFDAARIAQAFLAEPAAMSQRLVRAKARIRDAGLRFAVPGPEDLADRLADVLDAVYAAFGQGWDALDPPEAEGGLTGEAIWLARLLADLLPEEPEPRGLLALMLYCTARRDARRDATGGFVPLERQDPRLWDRNMVIEAEGLLTAAARAARFGRYQCEAAIQSVHVQRAVTGQLNHAALRTLYDLLVRHTDALGARLGRAVVIADAGDIPAAVAEIDALDTTRLRNHQPYWVARSHVETRAGMTAQAIASLQAAIALTKDPALRAHLAEGLARLHSEPDGAPSQDPG